MEEIPLQEEESSAEYRVLMAYAQRMLPASKFAQLMKPPAQTPGNGHKGKTNGTLPQTEQKKKKRRRKSLSKRLIPKCLRPASHSKEHPYCYEEDQQLPGAAPVREERWVRIIARRVRGIMKNISKQEEEDGYRVMKRLYSVEMDGDNEEELIDSIVQILRSAGDQLNDQMTQDQPLLERVRSLWSYSFFSQVTDHFLKDAVDKSVPEMQQQVNRIALCVHATTALTTLDNQPMNKVLGFGARYLKENYSHWIQSHGGLEVVMSIPDSEEVE